MKSAKEAYQAVLTDDPDLTRTMLGTAVSTPQAGTAARSWWRILGGGPEPGVLGVSPVLPAGSGPGPIALVRGRSSVSQYRTVRDHLTGGGTLDAPLVCLAGAGDRFEGQSGREWAALPGNLHLTLAWPCDLPAGPSPVAWTALPAVAVQSALEDLRPRGPAPHPGIKWVNDIMIAGAKVAGVLSAIRTREGRVTAVVYGLGLNVEAAPALRPSAFTPRAGSLREVWGTAAPGAGVVLRAILAEFARWQEVMAAGGGERVLAGYRSGSMLNGRRVGIWSPDTVDAPPGDLGPPIRSGVVAGIGPDLTLALEGDPEPVRSGRLALLDTPECLGKTPQHPEEY